MLEQDLHERNIHQISVFGHIHKLKWILGYRADQWKQAGTDAGMYSRSSTDMIESR